MADGFDEELDQKVDAESRRFPWQIMVEDFPVELQPCVVAIFVDDSKAEILFFLELQ